MGLKKLFEEHLLEAIKNKDDTQKKVIRMVLSSIKLLEVESGNSLEDQAIINILHKEIKTREETIAEALRANRPEMIDALHSEITILKGYLPDELSDDELKDLVGNVVRELDAKSIKDMGMVMKAAINEAQGKVSNERLSVIAKELLIKNN